MKRTASALWHGGVRNGQGSISTQSGVLSNTQYSFSTRFENGIGTNPEELIAAGHAGCFSMALSFALGNAGFTVEEVKTTATLTMENIDGGWTITTIHLDVTAKVPGVDAEKFEATANFAKMNCPVSKVLNAKITMDARLEA